MRKLFTVIVVCAIAGLVAVLAVGRHRERRVETVRSAVEAPKKAAVVPPGVIRPGAVPPPAAAAPRMAPRKNVNRGQVDGGVLKPLPNQSGVDVIPGEFVLSFRSAADRAVFMEKARARGIEIVDTMKLGNSVLVRAKRPADLQEALADSPAPAEYSSNHYVLSPEVPKNEPMQLQDNYVPFGSSALKWLGVTGENAQWGRGVVVAVLDNGITSHPTLREDLIGRVDLVNTAGGDQTVQAGHANAIASIIAGNGKDAPGVAPSSTLLSVRVLSDEGVGDSFTLSKGLVEAVDRGARVVNMSLGTAADSYILRSAVDYALQKDVALVAAVGNEGVDGLTYPAHYEGVIAVTAVDANGQQLYFANRGAQVDLAAPGAGVTTAWSGSELVGFSGTSAAVPFVSGAISYLLSENPGMKAAEAAALLVRYADDLGAPGRDERYGYGVMDLRRVMERNVKGVFDVAAGDVYVPLRAKEAAQVDIILTAQNRGTERIPVVELKADLNGTQWTKTFSDVDVGATVSTRVPFDLKNTLKGGGIGVRFGASAAGPADRYPGNNQRQVVIFTNPTSK